MSVDHFDSVAESYDTTLPAHVATHYLTKRMRFINSLLRQGSILDVGCGTGALTYLLKQNGYTVFGIDPSAGMLKVFRKRGGRRFIQASSEALPFRPGSFDLVITIAALHHIRDKEAVRQTLAEMVRVAKPQGGKVLVWDHNPNNPYWPILMRRLPQDQEGHRLIPLKEILEGLRRSGVRDVRVVRSGWVPDFAPRRLLPLFQRLESCLERIPGIRGLGAHNIVAAVRDVKGSADVER